MSSRVVVENRGATHYGMKRGMGSAGVLGWLK